MVPAAQHGKGSTLAHRDGDRRGWKPVHVRDGDVGNLFDTRRDRARLLKPHIHVAGDGRVLENLVTRNDAVPGYVEGTRIKARPENRAEPADRSEPEADRDHHPEGPQPRRRRDRPPPSHRPLSSHANTYFSIASATPSCATSPTTALATARSSGGAEPMATPNPTARSSGASFHESPIATTSSIAAPTRSATTRSASPLSTAGFRISTNSGK